MRTTTAVRDGDRCWWGPHPPGDQLRPIVIDSWLVQEGRSRRPVRHLRRFAAAADHLMLRQDLEVILDEVLALIPREGRWWPRVEAYNDAVALWLRPATDAPQDITVWVADAPDPRNWPHVKGSDLAVQTRVQERARRHGASDALLWRPDGRLPEALETTWSSLVWWDGERLVARPVDDHALPSITVECLEIGLADTPHPLARGRLSVDALLDKPVWAVNAARGVQFVREWVLPGGERRGTPHGPTEVGLGALLRDALERTTGPLPEHVS
ncbi:aminotransferase class IV [Arsenicicoccus dermatophilus]|uniref:aminotransferase class IV n=1 Tax=Arsenicicoccus dermatophilus TaxID=1076331 RepID=UPI001F4CCF48|nr:aminotransferase class IV [Arsenicicoccus dermatophilus]